VIVAGVAKMGHAMMLLLETIGLIAAGVGCALLARRLLTPVRKHTARPHGPASA
jgi:hypothetical protein